MYYQNLVTFKASLDNWTKKGTSWENSSTRLSHDCNTLSSTGTYCFSFLPAVFHSLNLSNAFCTFICNTTKHARAVIKCDFCSLIKPPEYSGFQMTVQKPKPKQLLRPITTGASSAMNQSQFLAILCNSLQAREKSRVHGAIGFGFASHWLKNWPESFQPITKRSNHDHVITFNTHLKTALKRTEDFGQRSIQYLEWLQSLI